MNIKTADLPVLAPGDAAWLLVLVQNAVPADASPDSPMNWEGKGRQGAYEMLAAAAGAHLQLCGIDGCPLGQGHPGGHVQSAVDGAA